jgi:hypothetical protein
VSLGFFSFVGAKVIFMFVGPRQITLTGEHDLHVTGVLSVGRVDANSAGTDLFL